MQKVKKVKIAIMAMVVVGFASTSVSVNAATNWKDYFSKDESVAIKKIADSYIRDQIEANAKSWKGIIDGKMIDNGSLSAKDVDSTVAKKKIYTGSIPCEKTAATKTTHTASSLDELTYFKKVDAPEIKMANAPIVDVLEKVSSAGRETQLASDIWKSGETVISEGAVWISFAAEDVGDPFDCFTSDYKIIVNY